VPCIHDIANGYFEPLLLPADVLRINHYTVKSKRHWAGDHIKRYQVRRMLTYADVCGRMLTYADVC
jgi:hypothetical protein